MAFLKVGGAHDASTKWVDSHHPQNGVFRAYWKDIIPNSHNIGGLTLNPNEGEGIRYEWHYKDGKRADGISKGWWPNGMLKQTRTYKDGMLNGKWTYWYENGQKKFERNMKDNRRNGECITWNDDFGEGWTDQEAGNGRKMKKETWKSQKLISSSAWTWKEGFKWVKNES